VEYLIKPATDQYIKQVSPSKDPNVKKPSAPDDILKTWKAVENLVKNKMKASSNQHSVQDYTLYTMKYMLENNLIAS